MSLERDIPRFYLELGDRKERILAGETVLGRSSRCEVAVRDPSMSRMHARIRRGDDGRMTVEDLGSSNGTFVNGRRIASETPLSDGDRLTLGETEVFVCVRRPDLSTAAEPLLPEWRQMALGGGAERTRKPALPREPTGELSVRHGREDETRPSQAMPKKGRPRQVRRAATDSDTESQIPTWVVGDEAGLGWRLAAMLVDAALIAAAAGLAAALGGDSAGDPGLPVAALVAGGLLFLMPVIGWAFAGGRTPGKVLFGLTVCDRVTGGAGLPLGRAMLRWMGCVLSVLFLFYGFLQVAWREDRMALHDRLAQSFVCRRS